MKVTNSNLNSFWTIPLLMSFVSCEATHLCVVVGNGSSPFPALPFSTVSSCDYTHSINTFSQEADKYSKSDTTVTFFGRNHNLTHTWKWRNVEDVIFRANGGFEVVIDCSPHDNNGFVFENVSKLSISDFHLIGCGNTQTVGETFKGLTPNASSALLFTKGSHLTLTNINISDAKAAGLYIYNVAGNITIDICKVTNTQSISGGKGPTSSNLIAYDRNHTVPTSIAIRKSTFEYQRPLKYRCERNNSSAESMYYTAGVVVVVGSAYLLVDISGMNLSHNFGCNGGNMALLFFSIPVNYREPMVAIRNSTFENGAAIFGGGLFVSFTPTVKSFHHNQIRQPYKALLIKNSTFKYNTAAAYGGGISIQWNQTRLNKILDATIVDSKFENNHIGHSGGVALDYKTYILSGSGHYDLIKFHVNLYISNCHFIHHSSRKGKFLSATSVIHAKSAPYLAIDGINITSNNCTALLAIDTTLYFYGSSEISNNIARSGAGIRLCSGSLMYLTPHTELIITDNRAYHGNGGGILVNSKCLVTIPMCFFQYTNYTLRNTVNVTIYDNTAQRAGDNLFGGSIDDCYLFFIRYEDIDPSELLNIPKNDYNESSISSNPQHVCFKDHAILCEKNKNITVYPGETKHFEVKVVGQLNGSVPGTVRAKVENGDVVIYNDQTVQTLNSKKGGKVNYTFHSSIFRPSGTGKLLLRVDLATDSGTHEYINSFKPAIIKVTFKDCPFGFSNQNTNYEHEKSIFQCKCMTNIIKECSMSDGIFTVTKRDFTWIGMFEVHGTPYLTTSRLCPLDYCYQKVTTINSTDTMLDQDQQCSYNRTGLLCGSCRKGFSLIFRTSECRENCSNWWLLLVIPFALAGIFLVFIITYLNLTVTTGTVCGLIFYANVIQDYSVLLLQEHPVPVLSRVLQIFIAWLNLDLGIPTCFYHGMQAFGKIALQAVFPVYIWLISAVIIFLSNRYISITRLVGQNAVKVLATLILLSYSKMLRVAISTLNQAVITVHVNNTKIRKLRWIIDGNVPYFNPQDHLILIIMAIIFLILTLPFALSLLCIRHVFSLSNCCRIFSWVNKLKPFFDAYTGPCKDSARFWTGLLLVTRLFLLLVHAIYSNDHILPFLTNVAICLVLSAIMISLNGVYKNRYLNVLECSFILNIGLLFTILVIVHIKITEQTWGTVFVSHLLVSVALLTFFGILAFHIYQKCSGFHWVKKRFLFKFRRDFDIQSMHYERLGEETIGDERSPSTEASDRLIHFPPIDYQSHVYERSGCLSSNK